MKKFAANLNPYLLVKHQKLSEELLLYYSKYLTWNQIIDYQVISSDFETKYKSYFKSGPTFY